MIAFRSLVFNALFYVNLTVFLLAGCWLLLAPRAWAIAALKVWARSSLWLLKVCCSITMEIRGREHLMPEACLVAGKHQSLWETFAILPLLEDPCMVLKKELSYIPLFGWFSIKFRMIAVERQAGPQALREMIKRARREAEAGRQIVIMPEGTRRGPDDPPDYKPGAAALYGMLQLPCIPFGLNAGLYWPRRKFLRYPGNIILEFCAAIPAGLPRGAFQEKLQAAIETTTNRLVAEGRTKHQA